MQLFCLRAQPTLTPRKKLTQPSFNYEEEANSSKKAQNAINDSDSDYKSNSDSDDKCLLPVETQDESKE